jgi:uncharacterized repeat protein (TIGR03943 family)
MKARAQGLALLVVGAVVLRIALFGEFLNYVKPSQYPWLILVGAGLMIVGVVGMVRAGRRPATEAAPVTVSRQPITWTHGPYAMRAPAIAEMKERERQARHGHDHSRAPWVAWLLYAPVIVMLLVPPPALGAYAAARGGPTVRKPVSMNVAPLPPGDPVAVKVSDYAQRAVWGHGAGLTGRTIALTGFVTAAQDGSWYLTRMLITCCAADALPYEVKVDGSGKAYPANTWLRVVGTYEPSTGSDPSTAVAQLKMTSIAVVGAPSNTYEQ